MANVILRVKKEDGSWAEIPALVGPKGPQGVSIDDIVLKSQEGDVSTYSILLSDGSEKTFQVTDGASITDVALISTDVLIDTYKISISDGSFFNFKVTNGRGIKSIAKTSTDVLSDTYTISYNDNTTSTYTITNGRGIDYIEKDDTIGLSDRYTIHYNDGSTSTYTITNGKGITKIDKSNTDVLTDTYTISYNDNTTSTYTVTNGRGIDYIEKDETIGLRDRYTIHYNDGSTSYYYVTNGEDGPAEGIGNRIYLSGLVDKVDDEEGYGRVKELKTSKFDKSKFTVVGNPTISEDGIASGFSATSVLQFPNTNLQNANTWEIEGVVKAISRGVADDKVWLSPISGNGVMLPIATKIGSTEVEYQLYLSSTNTSWDIASDNSIKFPSGSIVKCNLKFTGTQYIYTCTNLNTGEVKQIVKNSTLKVYQSPTQLGRKRNVTNLKEGELIYLKQFSITVDGKEVFSGNKTGIDTIKANNYEVVGSPVISDDGIVSGFSHSNFIKVPNVSELGKITESIRFTSSFVYNTLSEQTIWNKNLNFDFRLHNGAIILRTYNGTEANTFSIPQSQHKVTDGAQVFCDVVITSSLCSIKINGVEFTKIQRTDFSYLASLADKIILIGMSNAFDLYFRTSIDLNSFKIYVDGNLVYQPCLKIPYTQSKTGSKIVDVAYRDRVEDCYNQYGAGNYYLFSSATEQFALPMPDLYGLIENLNITAENLKLNITAIEGADW